MASKPKTVDVLVATPGGGTGQGGIDRMMAALRDELARQRRPDLTVDLAATRGQGSLALSPLHMMRFAARLLRLRRRGHAAVLHLNLASHGSTYRKLLLAGLAHRLGVPYVIHLHGGKYREFWDGASLPMQRRIAALYAGAARIVVLGRVWQRFIVERVPEAAGRVIVVPNATPRPTLPHTGGGDSVHILFLGRLEDAKGVPELGAALKAMEALPGWRATLAGNGHVEAARQKAEELGLADRVAIPGWVDAATVARLIAGADILVLPSHIENLPISVIEGMGSGLAVVATPVGAVEDIVTDGETGLLVQPGDVAGLAAALSRLVTDKPLRQRLGAAAAKVHRERLEIGPYVQTMAEIWADAAR